MMMMMMMMMMMRYDLRSILYTDDVLCSKNTAV